MKCFDENMDRKVQDINWVETPKKEDIDSYILSGYKGMHEQGYFGDKVKVAILDTGILASHPQFERNIVHINPVIDYGTGVDNNGHGTHVAGIVAEIAPMCDIYAYKVLDSGGGQPTEYGLVHSIVNAIDDSIDKKVNIISMSFGLDTKFLTNGLKTEFINAINRAKEANIFIVCSAGNYGNKLRTYIPASIKGITTVGSTDENYKPAYYSATNEDIDLCQVGTNVMSASNLIRNGVYGYTTMSGTSMATPLVTGMVALIIDKYREVRKKEPVAKTIYEILMSKAVDMGTTGWDNKTGAGFVTFKNSIKTIFYPYNKNVMFINGKEKIIPQGLKNVRAKNGETKGMLPIREDNEARGVVVSWERYKGVTTRG